MVLDAFIRLHNVVFSTKALDPGERAAIWLQGCHRRCPGCMSEETRPLDKGKQISIDKLADDLKKLDTIEGITISGGEPFLQKGPLRSLLTKIRENTNLGIIIYTGYTYRELQEMHHPDVNDILDNLCDLLIDGTYVEELNDGKRFKGSSNQQLIFLTERYKPFAYLYAENNRSVEIVVKQNEVFMYGIPDTNTLARWEEYKKQKGE